VNQVVGQSGEFTIITLPQLYFVIDNAPPVSQIYTKFSWNVTDTISIDSNTKVMKAETKWTAIISSQLFNMGYRILAERESDQSFVLLCEGENSSIGKLKVDTYWNSIQAALQMSLIINKMNVLKNREIGYYQEQVVFLERLRGQINAEFYQTIYYGTVRKEGESANVAKFYSNSADKFSVLHVGVAQCSVPYQKILSKGELPRKSGFVYNLFFTRTKMMPMHINYVNEMKVDDFKIFLTENINDCYVSYLRYLSNSLQNMTETICSEEDSIAIRKALVEDLCHKLLGTTDEQQLKEINAAVERLNKDEQEYLEILKQFENKLWSTPQNDNQDILLYMHGFHNSVEECFLRASQIACDIGFGGRLAVYSWPSLEDSLQYYQDRDQIDYTMYRFLEFLVLLCQGARKVHIIAHSAANLLFTRSALAVDSVVSQLKGKIGQIICAYADVKVEFFLEVFRNHEVVLGIENIADNVTIYYHYGDRVLWSAASTIMGFGSGKQSKRLVPNEAKLDNVNIGEIATAKKSLLCTFSNLPYIKHNVYAENPIVLEDMSEIINGNIKAYQRKHIKIACSCRIVKACNVPKLHCPLCGAKLEYVLDSFVL